MPDPTVLEARSSQRSPGSGAGMTQQTVPTTPSSPTSGGSGGSGMGGASQSGGGQQRTANGGGGNGETPEAQQEHPGLRAVTATTYAPAAPQVQRKIVITVNSAGAIAVPHNFSTQPSTCIFGIAYAAAGPAAGPANIWLNTAPPNTSGFDAVNVYLFASGAGTFEIYVG